MNDADRAARLRPEIEELQTSKIAEIFYAGQHVKNLLPLWFGEGDLPTPEFIKKAAVDALAADKVFYVNDQGVPELRAAIGRYLGKLHGRPFGPERIQVSPSGMSAIMTVAQATLGPGDELVYVAPVWPNIVEAARIVGATPVAFALDRREDGWSLDLQRLMDSCTPRTRAIFIASPGNPTGWMLDLEGWRTLVAFCRRRRIWLIADEVYQRLTFDAPRAASPLDVAEPDDPVFSTNSFSKSWSMTGWRLGWIVGPAWTIAATRKLTQYNTSGAATFVQWAGITALEQGEGYIAEQVARLRRARDLTIQGLSRFPRVRVASPPGAFYAFFRLDGLTDSAAFAKKLVLETGVGLAPGSAFGADGEGHLRLCFASSEARLSDALARMAPALA
jgi:aspartate/methionine/tyrosine aminotransferase